MCMCMHTNEEFLQNTKVDSLLNTIRMHAGLGNADLSTITIKIEVNNS